MSYTRSNTYTWPAAHISDSTMQFVLTVVYEKETGPSSGSSRNAAEYGLSILDAGSLEWAYEFEDALLTPGTMSIKIGDRDLLLQDDIFGDGHTNPSIKLELKLNGETEFIGYALASTIKFSQAERALTFTASPQIDLINKQMVYDEDGDSLNPFEYDFYGPYVDYGPKIYNMIEDIFQLVDSSITLASGKLEIIHDWIFRGQRYNPATGRFLTGVYKDDFVFNDLFVNPTLMYDDNSIGISTTGDVLRRLAADFGAFTGMIHTERAFFKKLFHYSATNLQVIDDVLDWQQTYRYNLIDYVKIINKIEEFSGTQTYHAPNEDAFTELADRFISRTSVIGFYVDGIYSQSNVQARTQLPSQHYYIQQAKDTSFDPDFQDHGELLSNFWYNFRGEITRCRVDPFRISGLNYEFLKDFNYGGFKYQPIRLKKNWAENETEIDALYLGAV